MAGQLLWSDAEIQILHAFAPDYDVLQKHLKGRTFEAIRHQCNRLGLSKTIHIWTGAEISKLRRLYPVAPKEAVIAAFPFSNWEKIKCTAHRHGFRRERLPYPAVEHPLMNAILERCAAIGWSLSDLDEECGTGRYFRSGEWKRHMPNFNAVLKAIEVLGGTVSVKWDE